MADNNNEYLRHYKSIIEAMLESDRYISEKQREVLNKRITEWHLSPDEVRQEEENIRNKMEIPLSDNEAIAVEEMRQKALHMEASRLYQAKMEGKFKAITQVAKNAYKEGKSIEFISEITGLPIEKLKQIIN
jgi:hypothetical protein